MTHIWTELLDFIDRLLHYVWFTFEKKTQNLAIAPKENEI